MNKGQENYLKNVELATEQNYNMIDGIPNNIEPEPTFPEEQPVDRVIEPPREKRSKEREDRWVPQNANEIFRSMYG